MSPWYWSKKEVLLSGYPSNFTFDTIRISSRVRLMSAYSIPSDPLFEGVVLPHLMFQIVIMNISCPTDVEINSTNSSGTSVLLINRAQCAPSHNVFCCSKCPTSPWIKLLKVSHFTID